jgi:hypothetical protein
MSFLPRPFLKNPFIRLVLATALGLGVAIAILLSSARFPPLGVKNFSWAGQKIGVLDSYFTLSFNRRVARQGVEENLVINPPLPGKISWAGTRLFYTLTELPVYGTEYEVQLQDDSQGLVPFTNTFRSRERAFVYIGVTDSERGKLILCNILTSPGSPTQLQKTTLTPNDLTVTDFAIYPEGDRLLFSAIPSLPSRQTPLKQELYTVTTGLNWQNSAKIKRSGSVTRVLDGQIYQNLRFAFAAQGKTTVVWRVNHNNPADASLWVIPPVGEPRPLGIQAENFYISPEGKILGMQQEQGIALIPLQENAGSPRFLADYEKIIGFLNDSSALVVGKNSDNTRSLYRLSAENEKKLLFRSPKPFLDCQLEPRRQQSLYCLQSDLVVNPSGQLQEEPFLSIIDLQKSQDIPLLALPNYRDVEISMSPDGVALLFDQVVTTPLAQKHNLITSSGQNIADGRLWLLPLPEVLNDQTSQTIIPQELNPGFKGRWLP